MKHDLKLLLIKLFPTSIMKRILGIKSPSREHLKQMRKLSKIIAKQWGDKK